ncbi:cupin domain-containing protein [Streptosporangium canum]|uniref:cupin domain-containing protein n=1 Tax=Streptosporangium canum TaxID=324952 RepID=UPI00378F4DB4
MSEDGEPAMEPRTCGVAESGSAVLLSGAYQGRTGISDRLLDALPDILVITDDECCFPLLTLVAAEVVRDRPGQQAVLDRLLDLMLVTTLRAWFDRPQRHAPVWYGERRKAGALRAHRLRPSRLRPEPWSTCAWLTGSGAAWRARRPRRRSGGPGARRRP